MTHSLVSIDIPAAERQIIMTLNEFGAPWTSATAIEQVLVSIEKLGLGLVRASADLEETWDSFDPAVAADVVWRGVRGRTAITLASADGAIRASVARYDRQPREGPPVHRNTVTLTLPVNEVAARGLAGVEALIAHLLKSLPGFSIGTASAANPVDYPALFDEPALPPPFVQTAWLHVLAPRFYESLGGAARFLGAPVRTEQRGDGSIWIWAYPDPFRYDTEEALGGIRSLSAYLSATA